LEANALSVQVHGGYGYTSEYLPEAWLRDQKLNSIHEGTTGIQSLDLLGRKVVAEGGAGLVAMKEEIDAAILRAGAAGVDSSWIEDGRGAAGLVQEITLLLAGKGLAGDRDGMLLHSADYLDLFAIVAIAWQWLLQAAAAKEGLRRRDEPFYRGKLSAAQYWVKAELPRVHHLARLIADGEDSYSSTAPDWF